VSWTICSSSLNSERRLKKSMGLIVLEGAMSALLIQVNKCAE
jgi:hypothetical protein